MSEQQNTGGTTTTTEETTNEQVTETTEFEAITSQEEFDKRIQSRIARERGKFPDYDELKAKAEKFDQIEDEKKTDTQRTNDRIAELERENAGFKAAQMRADVAREKSDPEKGIHVPAELLTGSTREELEASADALIQFKGESAGRQRTVIPGEGTRPTANQSTAEQFANWTAGQQFDL
ncbi:MULTISPECIES: hypothetical protein [unclassified Leucobacter]|uniref:hypothetical protein n=1 Tax=unclassified Leucobacter TaxID=2621730 RepID=UPI00069C182E|nr:hypothetical protein [Leucobacter sp. Ag1]